MDPYSVVPQSGEDHIHSIRIHRFARVEIQVLKIRHDMFGVVSLHTLLEILDEFRILARILEFLHNRLQISYSSRKHQQSTQLNAQP